MEVDGKGESDLRYKTFLEYLAHRAVDITEPVPIFDENSTAIKSLSERELPGRLSSLILPEAFNQRSYMYSDDEGNDTSLNSEREQDWKNPGPQFHFGIGKARLLHEETDVCVQHVDLSLYLFAKDEKVLRSLGEAVLKWKEDRERPDLSPKEGKYRLYTLDVHNFPPWKDQGWKDSRTLDSVFLPGKMLDSIVSDFRDFSTEGTKSWYISHGLPHRRSYLFYGPAGVGKTSTIRALSGALNLKTCFLTLGNSNMGNEDLLLALQQMPRPAMLVIEDVDALFNEDRKAEYPSQLTFSGLLNALDGLVSANGILTVMTTNYINRLDPALIRAGRVDRKFEFKLPSAEQMAALFASFYPDADKKLCEKFADEVLKRSEEAARSIATLQEHFIFTRGMNAQESIDSIDTFFNEFYPEGEYDTSNNIYT